MMRGSVQAILKFERREPRLERLMSATCIRVRMPCTMHGPEEPGGVMDHGANALSVIASLIDSTEEEIAALALEVADPLGTLTSARRPPQTRGDPQEPPAYRTPGAQR